LPTADGSKGSDNFGTAVFSRVPLLKVRYGIGHPSLDKVGRNITAIVNGRPFIWIYAPTSRMTIDDPRNDLKVEYIDVLSVHTANVRRDTGVDPFLFGDFNVARRRVDCSLHIDEGKWPSTYPKERATFERLLNSQNLRDAYTDCHPALNDPKAYQGSLDKHISWWSTRCDPPVGMRLDYLLAPRAHLSIQRRYRHCAPSNLLTTRSVATTAHLSPHLVLVPRLTRQSRRKISISSMIFSIAITSIHTGLFHKGLEYRKDYQKHRNH
jgi:exonuclease III